MYRQHRKKTNNKTVGKLLPGKCSLFGVERIFYFHLGRCANLTSEIDVLTHIKAQFTIEAKFESLECNSVYFNSFKITVKAFEKEKLLSALIWPRGVLITK